MNPIHLIDGLKLQKSKYSDVNIITYTPPEKHPKNKCEGVVDFIVRKWIVVDTQEEFDKFINDELDKENKYE